MIRPATINDAAAIVAIYNEYVLNTTITFEVDAVSVDEMAQRIAEFSANHPYLVYEDGGKVLGYAYAHQWKARAAYAHTWETTVYVKSDARHRGIGSLLMNELIGASRQAGVRVLIACITEENAPSVALHKMLGFQQVSCFKQVGYKFNRWLGVSDFELIL